MNAQIAIPTGAPMNPWFDTFWAKYGAIVVGIGIGTAAKWAMVMAEGRNLTVRQLAIDVLLAPMVALLTVYVASRAGMDPHTGAVLGALFALASDRVIQLVRKRFMQRVDEELRRMAAEQLGVARQVVAAEQSGAHVIEDTITGKAPTEYEALKKPRLPRNG